MNKGYRLLGDRVLNAWVGKPAGGILHFPTYTYNDLQGNGVSNLYKNVNHNNKHLKWHFIYFGYSK